MDLLLVLGVVLVAAFVGGQLAHKLTLPSVTGYILVGVVLGSSVTGLLGAAELAALEPINAFALGLIGLSIGGELKWRFLAQKWQNFGLLFLGESLTTLLLVVIVIGALSRNLALALILGVLALAPAPATILGVVRDYKTRGRFPGEVMSLVALDSLWCILAFTVVTTLLNLYYYGIQPGKGVLGHIATEIGPAIVLGVLLGFVGVNITNRIPLPKQRQVLITALLFLAVGLPRYLGISYLLVTLLTGTIIVNMTPKFRRFFDALQTVDAPVLVVFLTLAGARLQLQALPAVGILGAAYVVSRLLGKLLGSRLADASCRMLPTSCSRINPTHRRYIGLARTPQAGVAIGLSLLAEQQLPLPEGVVVTVIVGSVILFQLIGPPLIVKALRETGSIAEDAT